MESKMITIENQNFGTVRKIVEGNNILYCAADVTRALGYTNGRKAASDHCKGVTKRYTLTEKGGVQLLSYITEPDVYRLICHSKLPAALEFEKWVFEDVVPKAVDDKLNAEPEQLTLETSEYHYFPKTFNGEPVINVADFSHFTGIASNAVYRQLKRICILSDDYFSLSSAGIARYKRENPNVNKLQSVALLLKESAVRKLLFHFDMSADIPLLEEKKQPPAPIPAPCRDCVLKREPSNEMKRLMEHLHNEIKAIEGISYLLLCPDTKDNHENQREQLVKRINGLRNYSFDVSTIVIK